MNSTQETGLTVRMADLSPEYAEIMVLGNVLQKSGYFKDVRDQAQAVTKILCGRELGFSPIVSMQGIHIIEGKPALSSNLMATLIKRSGKYDYRVTVWSNTECVLMFREKIVESAKNDDGSLVRPIYDVARWEEVGESSFSMEDAKTAGLVRAGGSWSKYPKAMMFARALSQGLRTYCPDVSAAPIYNPEEMGATVGEDGDVIELPTSAKAASTVPRITVDIPLDGPAKPAAADRQPTVKGEAVPEKAVNTSPREPGSDDEPGEFIELGQSVAIHRAFKEAIRNPEAKKASDKFLQSWLEGKGFMNAEGKGTTKVIPAAQFKEMKEEAVKYAESLPA